MDLHSMIYTGGSRRCHACGRMYAAEFCFCQFCGARPEDAVVFDADGKMEALIESIGWHEKSGQVFEQGSGI